ncbi:MAG: hypothetical protein WCF84_04965 [Anaerolineae bacterium]
MARTHVPVLLFPFWALWHFVTGILTVTGRLLAIVLGLVVMIVGLVLSFTLIGAIVGIPLAILGFMLVLRGLF